MADSDCRTLGACGAEIQSKGRVCQRDWVNERGRERFHPAGLMLLSSGTGSSLNYSLKLRGAWPR